MALQNYNISSINQYLSSTYKIPNYQREYSWEEYELNDFWNDLINLYDNDDQNCSHFFGQIVIHNDAKEHEKFIIDGQQRTITSVIFLKVLCNHFARLVDLANSSSAAQGSLSKSVQRLEINTEDLLWKQDDEDDERRSYRLTLGEADNEYFEKNIMESLPSSKKKKNIKKSQERLRFAYNYLNNCINDQLRLDKDELSLDEQFKVLKKLKTAFLERFKVLYMEATDLSEAFTIFETLNARGKDLETADLLKNFFFSKCGDTSKALEYWNEMIDNLGNYDVTKYIRYFWNSSHKLAREKVLYREISNSILTKRDALDMMEEMSTLSICFHDLAFPNESSYFAKQEVGKILKNLSLLKTSTFYPVILAMEQSKSKDMQDEENILKVLEIIEAFIFRNFIISKANPNSAEVAFAALAKQIYDGDCSDVNQIIAKIKSTIVTDSIFEENFSNWSGGSNSKETIRYIFRKIHKYKDSSLEINIDNSDVQIEHIMPQDKSLWPQIDDQSHQDYLWKLGNLCLLDGSFNSSNSNKPFDDKKTTYMNSKIEPNKDIAKYTSWGIDEIKQRQKELAKDALNIWKI